MFVHSQTTIYVNFMIIFVFICCCWYYKYRIICTWKGVP